MDQLKATRLLHANVCMHACLRFNYGVYAGPFSQVRQAREHRPLKLFLNQLVMTWVSDKVRLTKRQSQLLHVVHYTVHAFAIYICFSAIGRGGTTCRENRQTFRNCCFSKVL